MTAMPAMRLISLILKNLFETLVMKYAASDAEKSKIYMTHFRFNL